MATTSIWSIKGWLGKLVIYVENPEKTEQPKTADTGPELSGQGGDTQSLADVIAYAVSEEKTKQKSGNTGTGEEKEKMNADEISDERTELMQQYVSGVNCSALTAREEMIAVKKRFGKNEGIMAFHGYQSFAPGECTPVMAHEIGVKLAEELWGERFQVIVATHLDKAHHLHNHFVVNSVSFKDGLRYHRSKKDYQDMRNVSDEFTTTSDFKEGAGHEMPAGTNVYYTADGKWDCLAGSPVSGVKGSSETTYRTGNVNITKANIGLGNVENKSSATIRSELTSANVTTALGYTPIQQSQTTTEIVSNSEPTGQLSGDFWLQVYE